MKAELNIPYSSKYRDSRLIDIFQPDGKRNGCAMFMVHGGGWYAGSREGWNSQAEYYTGLGFVVASVTYRLVPEAVFPAQIEDVRLGMSFFKNKAVELGIDKDKIAAVGSSAGGHLVALLSTILPEDTLGKTQELIIHETRPGAVVCYCPIVSLHDADNYPEKLMESRRNFMGCAEVENPELYLTASPVNRITGTEPPFLFIHGDSDLTVPLKQSIDMDKRLRNADVDSQVEILKGVGHGFGYGVTTDAQKKSLELIIEFINKVFKL